MKKPRRFNVVVEGNFREYVTETDIQQAIVFDLFMLASSGTRVQVEVKEQKDVGDKKDGGASSP